MSAPPVALGRRVAARLLDAVLSTMPYALAILAVLDGSWGLAMVFLGITILYGLASIVAVLATGALIGQRLLGQRHLDAAIGDVARGRTLGKYVVEGLVASVTFGVGYLIVLATISGPLRQSFVDRLFGIYVADERSQDALAAVPVPAREEAQAPTSPVVTSPVRQLDTADASPTVVSSAPTLGGPPSAPSYALVFDDGAREPLDPAVVLGRQPTVRPGIEHARLVPLDDPSMGISKSHVAVGVDAGGVWVMDVQSTNGVVVVDPHGGQRRIAVGARVPIEPGARLRIGGRECQVVS